MSTRQQKAILIAFAASHGQAYTPVQLQKFLFLVDRNVGGQVGGPYFDFQPYDYGPFDQTVYRQADLLEMAGHVVIDDSPPIRVRRYTPTPSGLTQGVAYFETIAPHLREYLVALSKWVRSLSFSQLVSAIYRDYPDMKERSIFKG